MLSSEQNKHTGLSCQFVSCDHRKLALPGSELVIFNARCPANTLLFAVPPQNHFCLPTTSPLPSLLRPGGVSGAMPPSRLGWQIFRTVSRGGDNPSPAHTPLASSLPLRVAMARDVCCQGEQHRGGAMATGSPLPSPLLPRRQRPLAISSCCRGDGEEGRAPVEAAVATATSLLCCYGSSPLASSCSAPSPWQQPRSSSPCPVATATASVPPVPKKGPRGRTPRVEKGVRGLLGA